MNRRNCDVRRPPDGGGRAADARHAADTHLRQLASRYPARRDGRRSAWSKPAPPCPAPGSQTLPRQGFACCDLHYSKDWINDGNYAELPMIPAGTPVEVLSYGSNRAYVKVDGKPMRLGTITGATRKRSRPGSTRLSSTTTRGRGSPPIRRPCRTRSTREGHGGHDPRAGHRVHRLSSDQRKCLAGCAHVADLALESAASTTCTLGRTGASSPSPATTASPVWSLPAGTLKPVRSHGRSAAHWQTVFPGSSVALRCRSRTRFSSARHCATLRQCWVTRSVRASTSPACRSIGRSESAVRRRHRPRAAAAARAPAAPRVRAAIPRAAPAGSSSAVHPK